MTLRGGFRLLLLLSVLALLAGGCGRKAKPEPLFGGGTAHHYETR
jgi:hypothetical protein